MNTLTTAEMSSRRRSFSTRFAIIAACVVATACAASTTMADVITYISATRYISARSVFDQNAAYRIDATGFEDFDVARTAVSRDVNTLYTTTASQRSRLLADRIEADCFSETAPQTTPSLPDPIGATSLCSVSFTLTEPSAFTLYVGNVFYQVRGDGFAAVTLLDMASGGGGTILFNTNTMVPPVFGSLPAGEYRLSVGAAADSRRAGTTGYSFGPARASAVFVVPAPASAAALLSIAACSLRRSR